MCVKQMLDPEGRPILAIVYHDCAGQWRPHAVVVEGHDYDFDPCHRDAQVYWHLSGSGPWRGWVELGPCADAPKVCARLWVAPGVKAKAMLQLTVRDEIVEITLDAAGYELLAETPVNPFDDTIEGNTYWCDTCQDRLPSNNPCGHGGES